MRVLRAGIAVWAFSEIARTGEWIFLPFGLIFALQAIFDVGCCGASGCAPQQRAMTGDKLGKEEITFEEVK